MMPPRLGEKFYCVTEGLGSDFGFMLNNIISHMGKKIKKY
jgi:hypothetical protein